METEKIVNLLNNSDNDSDNDSDNKSSIKLHSKFVTRKWHIINDRNNGQYGRGDENLKQTSLNQIFLITLMHIFL